MFSLKVGRRGARERVSAASEERGRKRYRIYSPSVKVIDSTFTIDFEGMFIHLDVNWSPLMIEKVKQRELGIVGSCWKDMYPPDIQQLQKFCSLSKDDSI